jgi:alkylation response protein AidB-like acyl-CoA dehydrogenase
MLQVVCDLVDTGGGNPTAAVSMAKLHCTALGVRVSARCVEILGEDGDLVDLGVERRLRDAKVAEIYDGTNQVQSMLIARDLRLSTSVDSELDVRQ